MAYPNGQIPDNVLVPISGRAGARLLPGPAAAWEHGSHECWRRYGWRPVPTGPSDAYRSLAVQVATFLDRYVPARTGGGFYGDIRWWNGVRYVRKRGKAAAAVPGTSNHGKGRAVDVTGLGGFDGLRCRQFLNVFVPIGWSNAEGRSVHEPWHQVDLLSPDLVSSGPATWPTAPTPANPVPPPSPTTSEEDDDMDKLIALYLNLTGRMPDPIGAIGYLSAIASGTLTWPQVAEKIADSDESKAFAALGSEEARNAKRVANAHGWIA